MSIGMQKFNSYNLAASQNQKMQNKKVANQVAFKGFGGSIAKAGDHVADVLAVPFAKGFGVLAESGIAHKTMDAIERHDLLVKSNQKTSFLQRLATSENLKKHISAFEGMWISGFYVLNTATNKKIPDERKRPLELNSWICGGIGLAGSYTLIPKFVGMANNAFDKLKNAGKVSAEYTKDAAGKYTGSISKFVEENGKLDKAGNLLTKDQAVIDKLKNVVKKEAVENSLKSGMKQLALLSVVTVMFRYVAPVIATPVSTKLNKLFEDKGVYKALGLKSAKKDDSKDAKKASEKDDKKDIKKSSDDDDKVKDSKKSSKKHDKKDKD